MNIIDQWAKAYNIPHVAIHNLKARLTATPTDPVPSSGGESEAKVSSRVRLEASKSGARLWRNNVGACKDENGNYFRYGLCNDSKKLNDQIKSSDLVGIRPIVIRPEHVGRTIGQFMCREVKKGGWRYRGDHRELAQLAWINMINAMGGDAQFCNSEGTV